MISSWRWIARVLTAAPSAPRSWCRQNSVQFQPPAVQRGAPVRIHREGADPERRPVLIRRPAAGDDLRPECVEIRFLERPEARVGDGHRHFEIGGLAGRDFPGIGCLGYDPLSGGIEQFQLQGCRACRGGLIAHAYIYLCDGGLFLHLWGAHKQSASVDVQRVEDGQPDVAVDSASRIPAAGGLFVFQPHGDGIRFPQRQVRRQVVFKGNVSVRPRAEQNPIDPHPAVHVRAVELEEDPPAPPGRRGGEGFPVPAGAAVEESAAGAGGRVFAERERDAPIVRQVQAAPRRIIQRGIRAPVRFSQPEFPSAAPVFSPHSVVGVGLCIAGGNGCLGNGGAGRLPRPIGNSFDGFSSADGFHGHKITSFSSFSTGLRRGTAFP